jgi:methionine-S-sulfoxide reductase
MQTLDSIALGGGCFWCTEAVFKLLKGIKTVASGYAGGTTKNPSYDQVSGGQTGYAEVVYLEYDPREISLRDILIVFFASHDPTTKNRQGDDIGTQYRSIVFYQHSDQQHAIETFIDELNRSSRYGAPIITEVKPLDRFYEAELHHQNYYSEHRDAPYCQIVINPKLEHIKAEFAALLKDNTNNNSRL